METGKIYQSIGNLAIILTPLKICGSIILINIDNTSDKLHKQTKQAQNAIIKEERLQKIIGWTSAFACKSTE